MLNVDKQNANYSKNPVDNSVVGKSEASKAGNH